MEQPSTAVCDQSLPPIPGRTSTVLTGRESLRGSTQQQLVVLDGEEAALCSSGQELLGYHWGSRGAMEAPYLHQPEEVSACGGSSSNSRLQSSSFCLLNLVFIYQGGLSAHW